MYGVSKEVIIMMMVMGNISLKRPVTHVQGVPSTSREFSRPSFLIPEVCAKIRPLKKLKNFLGGKFFALVSMR